MREYIRNDVWNRAVILLIESQILQPLGIKSSGVEVERCCGSKNLRVARPSQTLVALRTIGRNIQEIAFLSPDNIVLELIEKGARGFEVSGLFHRRVNDDTGELLRINVAGPSAHGYITKPLKGEVRLVDLLTAARCYVADCLPCRT